MGGSQYETAKTGTTFAELLDQTVAQAMLFHPCRQCLTDFEVARARDGGTEPSWVTGTGYIAPVVSAGGKTASALLCDRHCEALTLLLWGGAEKHSTPRASYEITLPSVRACYEKNGSAPYQLELARGIKIPHQVQLSGQGGTNPLKITLRSSIRAQRELAVREIWESLSTVDSARQDKHKRLNVAQMEV